MQNELNSGKIDFVTWKKNEDNTFTFYNTYAEALYAWYVLDSLNEVIYKTVYSNNPSFTYDFNNNRDIKLKAFVRIKDGEDEKKYEQYSCVIESAKLVPREKYKVEKLESSYDIVERCKDTILAYGLKESRIKVEEILAGQTNNFSLTIPVDWNCNGLQDRSLCHRLHGFSFLDNIYVCYEDKKEEIYKNLIMDYILDWIKYNREPLEGSMWAWHDDAVARRMLRFSYYYYLFKDDFSEEAQNLIEESMDKQAKLLSQEEFYTERHNHGMYQDLALLIYTMLCTTQDNKKQYFEIIFSRTASYFDYAFCLDGVHKEHSPYYARDVFTEGGIIVEVSKDICPDFAKKYSKILDGGKEYLLQIIKPDGSWPAVGDSHSRQMLGYLHFLDTNDQYKYLVSNGCQGKKPSSDSVFLDGGYAIMRSDWDDSPEEATWIMFLAATHSSVHKHSDDLSFLIYHRGELFVEAGKRDYNYLDELTAWGYSGYAHNVLLVDGECFPVKKGANGFQSIYPEALKTGIIDYDLGNDVKWVTGMQRRFAGISQYRTLLYNKNEQCINITDNIIATTDFKGTLLYHIADGIKIEATEKGWKLYRDAMLVADVYVNSNVQYCLDTVSNGEGQYPYQTWIFKADGKMDSGGLLMINAECKTGSNSITLEIRLY